MGGLGHPDHGLWGDRVRVDAVEPLPVSRRRVGLATGRRALERQGADAGSLRGTRLDAGWHGKPMT